MTPPSPDPRSTPPARQDGPRPRETEQPRETAAASNPTPTAIPEQFGRYRILKRLGQGGMGSVYLALDEQLDRQVALKVPRFAANAEPKILQRFLIEARAAAGLRHPNLCTVYEVGQVEGVHYLAMAYVEGKPLTAYIDDDRPLPAAQAAALVRKLALALQEAHSKGVIHRDLKPSNIMIDRRREPIVMDFGLARRIDRGENRLTQTGALLGTPTYMPPEQAQGDVDAMGPGSDIYSLGVILYELLTGRPPFEGPTMAVLAQVLYNVPDAPSAKKPGLDPRLDAICLRTLAKKPADRFASMAEFAAALTDHLRNTGPAPATTAPTLAAEPTPKSAKDSFRWAALQVDAVPKPKPQPAPSPPSAPIRGWPWLAGAAALGVVGVAVAVFFRPRPDKPPSADEPVAAEPRIAAAPTTPPAEPPTPRVGPKLTPSKEPEPAPPPEPPTEPEPPAKKPEPPAASVTPEPKKEERKEIPPAKTPKAPEPPPALRKFTVREIQPVKFARTEPFTAHKDLVMVLGEQGQHWGPVQALALSPDGKQLASGGDDMVVRLWEAETLQFQALLPGHTGSVRALAYTPDGKRLVSGSDDHTVRVWDPKARKAVQRFEGHKDAIRGVAASNRFVASACADKTVGLWDLRTGSLSRAFTGHDQPVLALAIAANGTVFSASADNTVRGWDPKTGREFRRISIPVEGNAPTGAAFTADAHRVLLGTRDLVRVWDLEAGRELWRRAEKLVQGPNPSFHALACSRDGKQFLFGNAWNRVAYPWDPERPAKPEEILHGHNAEPQALAFSSDGTRAFTGNLDGSLRVWELDTCKEVGAALGHKGAVTGLTFSPDARQLLTTGRDWTARLWDLTTGQQEWVGFDDAGAYPHTSALAAAFTGDGRRVLVAGKAPTPVLPAPCTFLDVETWTRTSAFEGHKNPVIAAAVSRDGLQAATSCDAGILCVWETLTGNEIRRWQPGAMAAAVALAPDGKTVAFAGNDLDLRLWDVASGQELRRFRLANHGNVTLSFAPDSRMLVATIASSPKIRVWDLSRVETAPVELEGHKKNLTAARFGPDRKLLASAGEDGLVLLWDLSTGKVTRTWALPGPAQDLAFLPDGHHLATANANGTVFVLRLSPRAGTAAR